MVKVKLKLTDDFNNFQKLFRSYVGGVLAT